MQSSSRKFRFPGKFRIKTKRDFDKYFKESGFKAGKFLVVRSVIDPEHITRLGLSISKKDRNAIIVNRLKRLVREAFRLNRFKLKDNLQLIISYKRKISYDFKLKEVEEDFLKIMKILNLLKVED